jgi:hypothetical protein
MLALSQSPRPELTEAEIAVDPGDVPGFEAAKNGTMTMW